MERFVEKRERCWLCRFVRWSLGCGLIWGVLWGGAWMAFAASVPAKEILACGKLAEERKWLDASECYEKLSALIPESTDLNEEDRTQKGYLLSESSRCLEREAMREEKPVVAAYLREKALRNLELVLQRRWLPLIRGKRRTRVYAGRVVDLRRLIRYTPLAISTSSPDAQVQVSGFQFLVNVKGQFNQALRPGDYKVLVSFPNETTPRIRQVTLHPQMPLVLSFAQKPKIPALLIAGYVVGSAAVVGGGVLIGLGAVRIQEGNNCFADKNCGFYQGNAIPRSKIPASSTDNESEFRTFNNISMSLLISGIVVAVVGVGALVTAGIVHANLAKEDFIKREAPQTPPPAVRSLLWSSDPRRLPLETAAKQGRWTLRELQAEGHSLRGEW